MRFTLFSWMRARRVSAVLALSINDFTRYRGSIIGSWALVESSLDQINKFVWASSDEKSRGKIPVSFNRKVAFYEIGHRNIDLLDRLQPQGLDLLKNVKAMLNDRHDLAHGYLWPENCGLNHWTLVRNVFQSDGSMGRVKRRFTRSELNQIERTVRDLVDEAVRYMDVISREAEKHLANNIDRQ